MDNFQQLRELFINYNNEQKADFIGSLSLKELYALYDNPDLFLFDKQIIPDTNARYIILRCGRRFGKSVAGSAFIAKKIKAGAKQIGLAGVKHEDIWKIMVPAILSWFPKKFRDKSNINQQKHMVILPNGCQLHTFTSDAENRGMSLEYLWCDEVGSWCDSIDEKVKMRFQIIDTAVSSGPHPQTIITSTPKPFTIYKEWQKEIDNNNPDYHLIIGNMNDNPFLSENYKRIERIKYGSSRFGRQEYFGELLLDTPGALWTNDMLDKCRANAPESIYRIVLAVDPAASAKGDETGIIVAGLAKDGNVYVLLDASGHYTPDAWANKVNKLFNEYKVDRIIAEKNQGGDMVEYTMKTVNPFLPIKLIHANRGKILRAEPVAALYEQGKVKHINVFNELEHQMMTYTGNNNQQSPDRLDALVYAVSELMLEGSYSQRAGSINVGYY